LTFCPSIKIFLGNGNHLDNLFIWEFWESKKFWESLVILGKTIGNKHRVCKCFLRKANFYLFFKHFGWMIPFYYYLQACEFNDPWTDDSPHFSLFFIFYFFEKTHLWNFGLILNTFMNVCNFLGIHIWYMFEYMFFFRKCIYECMIFGNAYIMYVWVNSFWENTFMNAWFFWNAYIMYV